MVDRSKYVEDFRTKGEEFAPEWDMGQHEVLNVFHTSPARLVIDTNYMVSTLPIGPPDARPLCPAGS